MERGKSRRDFTSGPCSILRSNRTALRRSPVSLPLTVAHWCFSAHGPALNQGRVRWTKALQRRRARSSLAAAMQGSGAAWAGAVGARAEGAATESTGAAGRSNTPGRQRTRTTGCAWQAHRMRILGAMNRASEYPHSCSQVSQCSVGASVLFVNSRSQHACAGCRQCTAAACAATCSSSPTCTRSSRCSSCLLVPHVSRLHCSLWTFTSKHDTALTFSLRADSLR